MFNHHEQRQHCVRTGSLNRLRAQRDAAIGGRDIYVCAHVLVGRLAWLRSIWGCKVDVDL